MQLQKDSEGNQSEPANFKLPADGTGNGGNLGNNGSTGLQNLNATQKNLSNNGEIVNNLGVVGALLLGVFVFFTFKRKNKEE